MTFLRIMQMVYTKEEWDTKNPVLRDKEIGFERAEGTIGCKMKIGDGVTPWVELPYLFDCTPLDETIENAEETKTALNGSIQTGADLKDHLEKSIEAAGTAGTALDEASEAAANATRALEDATSAGAGAKQALDDANTRAENNIETLNAKMDFVVTDSEPGNAPVLWYNTGAEQAVTEKNGQLIFKDELGNMYVLTPAKGVNGVGISSIKRTSGDGGPGTTDTYTITLSNGQTANFYVYNGADGKGGDPGANGKTAYQYAQEGGYTGSEEEFAAKLAAEYQQKITTSGLLKGDGNGGVSAAVEGTDYLKTAPVTSVNNKTGAVSLTASDVGADASGTASGLANRTTKANAADTNYTTLMFRGESLHSAETTPTVNGAICWTYE